MITYNFHLPIAITCIRQFVPASCDAASIPRRPTSVVVGSPLKVPHEPDAPHLKAPQDTVGTDIKGIGNVHARDPIYNPLTYEVFIAWSVTVVFNQQICVPSGS